MVVKVAFRLFQAVIAGLVVKVAFRIFQAVIAGLVVVRVLVCVLCFSTSLGGGVPEVYPLPRVYAMVPKLVVEQGGRLSRGCALQSCLCTLRIWLLRFSII